MNMDNLDPGTLDQNVQEFGQPKRRGWWSRNWLWFVPTLLLFFVLLCCGCPGGIAYFFFRTFPFEVFQTATLKIEADKDVQRELGQPITPIMTPPPSFRSDDREADIRWDIEGPKGRAKAHVLTRKTGAQWEIVVLEVVLANGKKISLAGDGGGDMAPPFETPKPETKKPEAKTPAPEINLPTFPDDGPGKK